MNFPAALDFKSQWHYQRGVSVCETCNGAGSETYYIGTYGSPSCQGPSERYCEDCETSGVHACDVCGNDEMVSGYDCVVCEMVHELTDQQLTTDVANTLYESILAAMAARRAHAEKAA